MKLSKGYLALIIIVLIVIIDQVFKIWTKTHFYYGESYRITDWFQLVFIENNGMAFGWEVLNKIILSAFRVIASILFVYYIIKIKIADIPTGYMACVALIAAGTIGNTIDCVFYGQIFNNPMPPELATLFPNGGGYAPFFEGRVVDMLYFPLAEWNWPSWIPVIGGKHFLFFQPIFNIADAALSVGVVALLIFYSKYLSTPIPNKTISSTKEMEAKEEE